MLEKAGRLAATALLIALAPGFATEARAEADLFFGIGFRVGDAHFRIAHRDAAYGPDRFYFAVDVPLRYEGYRCDGYCYRDRGRYYHDYDCPLVRRHLRRYGYAPYDLVLRYAPHRHAWRDRDRYRHGDRYRDRRYRDRWYRDRRYRDRHDRRRGDGYISFRYYDDDDDSSDDGPRYRRRDDRKRDRWERSEKRRREHHRDRHRRRKHDH